MPLDSLQSSTFRNGLFNSVNKYTLTPSNIEGAMNFEFDRLSSEYGEEDKEELRGIAVEVARELKDARNLGRVIPIENGQYIPEFAAIASAPPEAKQGQSENEYISAVDDWKTKEIEKLNKVQPSSRDDNEAFFDGQRNQLVREGRFDLNPTGFVVDKLSRFAQGGITAIGHAVNPEWTDKFLAENLPAENPKTDEDWSSVISGGLGQAGVQLGVTALATYAGGPTLGASASLGMIGSSYMQNSYLEEMRKSGDSDKALANAIAQTPIILLESFSDKFALGLGKSGKLFKKEITEATTDAAKAAVLKKYLPSFTKTATANFLEEGIVGGAATDFGSAIASAKATGDDSYLENLNFESVLKSSVAEGLGGAIYGGPLGQLAQGKDRIDIAKQLGEGIAHKTKIASALKSRNFEEVVRLTNEGPTPDVTSPAPVRTPAEARKSGVVFNKNGYDVRQSHIEELEKEINDPATPQELVEKKKKFLEEAKAGTLVTPSVIENEIEDSEMFFDDPFPQKKTPDPLSRNYYHEFETEKGKYDDTQFAEEDETKDGVEFSGVFYVKKNGINFTAMHQAQNTTRKSAFLAFSKNMLRATIGLKSKDGKVTYHKEKTDSSRGSENITTLHSDPKDGFRAIRVTVEKQNGKKIQKVEDLGIVKKSNKVIGPAATVNPAPAAPVAAAAPAQDQYEITTPVYTGPSSDVRFSDKEEVTAEEFDSLPAIPEVGKFAVAKEGDTVSSKGKVDSFVKQEPVVTEVAQPMGIDELFDAAQNEVSEVSPSDDLLNEIVTFQGYTGRLRKDGERFAIETPDRVVELTEEDLVGVEIEGNLSNRVGVLNSEIAGQLKEFSKELGSADVNLVEAKFTPRKDVVGVEQNGELYVPQNRNLSKSVVKVGGLPALRLRSSSNKILLVRGNQAQQAIDALLESAVAAEARGDKVRFSEAKQQGQGVTQSDAKSLLTQLFPGLSVNLVSDKGMVTAKGKLARGSFSENGITINLEGIGSLRELTETIAEELYHAGFDETNELYLLAAEKLTQKDLDQAWENYAAQGEDVVYEEAIWTAIQREVNKLGGVRGALNRFVAKMKSIFVGGPNAEDSYKAVIGRGMAQMIGKNDSKIAAAFLSIADNEESFKFGQTSDSKDMSEIALAYGGDTFRVKLEGNVIELVGEKSKFRLKKSNTTKPEIDSFNSESGQGGSLAYQIFGTWAANNGKTIVSKNLTEVNKIRRASNMISSFLRHGGRTDHFAIGTSHGEGYILGKDESNLGKLLKFERDAAYDAAPELSDVTYDFEQDAYTMNGIPLSEEFFENVAKTAFVKGVGATTAKRAVLTTSVEQAVGLVPVGERGAKGVLYSTARPASQFSFRAESENADSGFLFKLKIAKDGTVPLKALNAKIRKSGSGEFEKETLAVLANDLEEGGRVNAKEFLNIVQTIPTVIVSPLDFSGKSNLKDYEIEVEKLQQKKGEVLHKIDTEFPGWQYNNSLTLFESPDGKSMPLSQAIEPEPRGRSMPRKMQNYIEEAGRIQKQISEILIDNEGIVDMSEKEAATGRYGVDPYTQEELKGIEELSPGHKLVWSGDLSLNIPLQGEQSSSLNKIDKSLSGNNYIIEKSFPIEEKYDKLEEFTSKYPEPRYFVTTSESSIYDENRTVTIFVRDTGATEAPKPKFTSQHYSGAPSANQLAFVRGGVHQYLPGSTLPNGTVAKKETRLLEIWEVQSDWAGRMKQVSAGTIEKINEGTVWAIVDSNGTPGKQFESKKEAEDFLENLNKNNGTPLLEYWESYALQAALNFAQEQNADFIAVSDAETAMMTEGHDNVNITPNIGDYILKPADGFADPLNGVLMWYETKESAENAIKMGEKSGQFKPGQIVTVENKEKILEERPTQEKGMRAAYDVRIPNGLAKLTNSKPQSVTIGEHHYNKTGSKVFKEKDGKTPKYTNTARMFRIPSEKKGLRFSTAPASASSPSSNFAPAPEFSRKTFVLKELNKVIAKIRGKKVEAGLNKKEKQAYSMLKNIKWRRLELDQIEEFQKLLENFVETRSRGVPYPDFRDVPEDVFNKISYLSAEAEKREVEELFEENPDVFESMETSAFPTAQKAKEYLNKALDLSDFETADDLPKTKSDDQLELEDSIESVLADIRENLISFENGVPNNEKLIQMLGLATPENAKFDFIKVEIDELLGSLRTAATEFAEMLVKMDYGSMSHKQARLHYYRLLSLLTEGSMKSMYDYVPSDLKALLGETFNFRNPKTGSILFRDQIKTATASLRTKMDFLSGDSASRDVLNKIAAPFREALTLSKRIETKMLKFSEERNKFWETKRGRRFTSADLSQAGIYAYARAIHEGEEIAEGLAKNKAWVKKSISNYEVSYKKKFRTSADNQYAFLEALYDGVEESDSPLERLEENAKTLIGEEAMGLVEDYVDFFEYTKPAARFTTTFMYGRDFKEVRNYMPAFSIPLGSSTSGVSDDTPMNMDDGGFAGGLHQKNAFKKGGMTSTFERERKMSGDRALIFNLNHLFFNRGRLNMHDYATGVARRGMHNLMNSDSFSKFLGDKGKNSQLGRVSFFKEMVRGMWQNSMANNSYVNELHSFVNAAQRKFAAVQLSGAHQIFSQTASAFASYFASHLVNPARLWNFFDSSVTFLKWATDPTKAELLKKIMFDIKNRSQDVLLDTNANLGSMSGGLISKLKENPLFRGASAVDQVVEKVQFTPFKLADFLSGEPIMFAEYIWQEKQRTGNFDSDAIQYNPESYTKALDETERHIGIGDKTRRAEFLQNKTWPMAVLRSMSFAFATHATNNISNFQLAMKDLADGSLSVKDRAQALSYAVGIGAQSAAFITTRNFFKLLIANALISSLDFDTDDEENEKEIERLARERLSAKGQKLKIVDAEIQHQKDLIRLKKELRRDPEEREVEIAGNKIKVDTRTISFLQDMSSQMFLSVNATTVASYVGHLMFDEGQADLFEMQKAARLGELKDLIKTASRAKKVEYMKEQYLLEAQQFIDASPKYGGDGLPGANGILPKMLSQIGNDIGSIPTKMIHDESYTDLELANFLAIVGIGQADFRNFLKTRDKVLKLQKENKARIEEIQNEKK